MAIVKASTVDEYIEQFSDPTQERLRQIRKIIKDVAPDAQEMISYAIAAYKIDGHIFIYFAGYENHIGLYPLPHTMTPEFADQIEPYVAGKGTLKFNNELPLPLDLIKKVAEHRLFDSVN